MKPYLIVLLFALGLLGGFSGHSQNKFVLQKEEAAARDSVFSVIIPAPNTGAVCVNMDSIRREISGNREVYLEWRRSREQARYLVDLDATGKPSNFRTDGETNGMYEWMQAYLGPMRFRPAWSARGTTAAQPLNPDNMNGDNSRTTRPGTFGFVLPGFVWPSFEQEYYLDDLVKARCRSEKPGECVEGYVRMRVLLDRKGKPLSHELLAGKNEFLNKVVGEEIYKTGFRPATAVDSERLPDKIWGFLDFEFSAPACR